MDDRFLPVAINEIRALESRIKAPFPKEYVEFLVRYGGCGFSGDANVIYDCGRLPIFTFFDNNKLLSKVSFYDDLTAESKLAIADDMAGNPFVLDCLDGCIYYLDFSVNPPVGTKIAKSFDRFFASIHVESSG